MSDRDPGDEEKILEGIREKQERDVREIGRFGKLKEKADEKIGNQIGRIQRLGNNEEDLHRVEREERELEEILEKQTEIVKEEIEDLEGELSELEELAYDFVSADEEVYQTVVDDLNRLEEIKDSLNSQLKDPDAEVLNNELEELENILERLMNNIDFFDRYLQNQAPFLQEFQRNRKPGRNLRIASYTMEEGSW